MKYSRNITKKASMMLSPQRSTRTHQKPYKGYDSGVGYSVALPLYRNLDKGERKKTE